MKIADFYKRNGCRLIEIPKGSKAPTHVKQWQKAERSFDEIESLVDGERFNKAGWILSADWVVIDIDTHDPEKNGWAALEKLERETGCGSLTEAAEAVVESPSGGCHLYFRKPSEAKVRKSLKEYPGLDFLTGPGMQVITAGSEHDSHAGKVYGIFDQHERADLPASVLAIIVQEARPQEARPVDRPAFVEPPEPRSGDEFNQSDAGLQMLISEMQHRGYTFTHKGDYWEWTRPGKTSGNHFSGHLGKRSREGNYQLYCFSTADPYFPPAESISIFHAFAMLCHGGNHTSAAAALHDRGMGSEQASLGVDLSYFLGQSRNIEAEDDDDDEEFCRAMVPADGLLREVFDAYWESSYRRCAVLGLVTSIGIVQTAIGRKVQSWTGLSPNDYHLVLAPTASGKEGPLTFASKLFSAAGNAQYLMPEKFQSGNGLLAALAAQPSAIWFADEFGKVLASILDAKGKNPQARAIADALLVLYGKSSSRFNGSAYAAGKSHEIEAPHLSIVGVATGHTVFSEISQDQVLDGMLGRIAFWRVRERPEKNRDIDPDISDTIAGKLARWLAWSPGLGNLADLSSASLKPSILRLEPTPEARQRWQGHEDAIDTKMESERAIRSALWGRVAARSMKLAMVHRMARIGEPAAINEFNFPELEIEDINWGIKLANWSANLASDLVRETVKDAIGDRVAGEVYGILKALGGSATMSQVSKKMRRTDVPQIRAAVTELEQIGKVTITQEPKQGRGRPAIRLDLVD